MADKEEFLIRIRNALGRKSPGNAPAALNDFSFKSAQSREPSLINLFCSQVRRVSGNSYVIDSTNRIADCVRSLIFPHQTVAISNAALLDKLEIKSILEKNGNKIITCQKDFGSKPQNANDAGNWNYKQTLMEAAVGITSADYAIADTGTLVLLNVNGGEQSRTISLIPPKHICIIEPAIILPSLSDVLDILYKKTYSKNPIPLSTTFITGPSRTGDIEQTITLGMHGPQELHILIISPLSEPSVPSS